jgi:hypothetical protein
VTTHPHGSWYNFVQYKCAPELDNIRKRAWIAYRKAAQAAASGTGGQVQSDVHPSFSQTQQGMIESKSPTHTNAVESPARMSFREQDEQDDFEAICRFFAGGGGNDSDDEQVWSNLANYVSRQSRITIGMADHRLTRNDARPTLIGQSSIEITSTRSMRGSDSG